MAKEMDFRCAGDCSRWSSYPAHRVNKHEWEVFKDKVKMSQKAWDDAPAMLVCDDCWRAHCDRELHGATA